MPTYEPLPRFLRDYSKLTAKQVKSWKRAYKLFVLGLKKSEFDPSLRIKRVQGTSGKIWEITWASDGRATFQYGGEKKQGETHVIWRRIGTHDVFRAP